MQGPEEEFKLIYSWVADFEDATQDEDRREAVGDL